MKKFICILLSLCVIFTGVLPVFAEENSCGESAVWSFSRGVLTIGGSGAVQKSPDWKNISGSIYTVKIEDGIEAVSGGTFYDLTELCDIYVPESVKDIGDNFIPDGVTVFCYEGSTAQIRCKTAGYDCHIHAFSDVTITEKAPTCTEEGREYKRCTIAGCDEVVYTVIPPEHNFSQKTHIPPTCMKDGYYVCVCSRCGAETTEPSANPADAATGHEVVIDGVKYDLNHGVVTKEPTCTEDGTLEYICTRCGEKLIDTVVTIENLGGHDFTEYIEVRPTCQSTGKKVIECRRCDYTEEVTLDVLPHDYGNPLQVVKEPTCTEAGITEYMCSLCNQIIQQPTAATGHVYGDFIIEKEATCTENGSKYKLCEVCGEHLFESVIPAKGHSPAGEFTVVTPATCTENGEQAKLCEICGEPTEKKIIPATGHDFNTEEYFYEMKDGSCENGGIRFHKCKNCSERIDIEPVTKLSHEYSAEFTVDLEPTCTENGSKSRHCIRCEAKIEQTAIPALSHDFTDEYIIDTEPTCTEAGTESRHCRRCTEKSEPRLVAALGHDYAQEMTIDEPATCVKAGSMSRHCLRCDARVSERLIAATGHDYVTAEIIEESTCSKEGTALWKCNNCGEEKTEALPLTAHICTEECEIIDPTCTEEGCTLRKCIICGMDVRLDLVPPLGHKYTKEQTVQSEATCEKDGQMKRTCVVCGELDVTVYPATGHNYGSWADTLKPTILYDGYKSRRCATCGNVEKLTVPKLECDYVTDEATGIYIAYQTALHKGKMSIKVEDLTKDAQNICFKKITGLSKIYKATLLEDGKPVESGELYLLSIPKGDIPAGLLQFYQIDKNGYPFAIEYMIQSGELICEPTEFSPFALAENKDSEAVEVVKGDMNFDGKVKAADARLALRVAAKLDTANEKQLDAADLDGDRKISAAEARIILRVAAGLQKFN